jgi:outer membrane lipoprotein-sorting protein
MKQFAIVITVTTTILLFFSHSPADTGDVSKVIELLQNRYESIQDYQCRIEESSTLGSRREERIINLYFKRPRMIRLDILKGNRPFDRGSVAIYSGDDWVIGHRGGLLKNITLRLPTDHGLATTIRGVRIDQSDLLAVLQKLIFLNANGTVTIFDEPPYMKFRCEPFDPALNEGIETDIAWVDHESLLLVRTERYENGRLVQEVTWKNYIVNSGLPDKLFDARFEVNGLMEENIPLLGQKLE